VNTRRNADEISWKLSPPLSERLDAGLAGRPGDQEWRRHCGTRRKTSGLNGGGMPISV